MNQGWQLKALMKKNFILMKRSIFASICEIFFPIFLMVMMGMIRRAIKKEVYTFDGNDNDFLKSNSTALINQNEMKNMQITPKGNGFDISWKGLSFYYPFLICNKRTTVGIVGQKNSPFSQQLKQSIQKVRPTGLFPPELLNRFLKNLTFMDFEDNKNLTEYLKSKEYGANSTFPELCFAVYLQKISERKYSYSLSYFDSIVRRAPKNIPTSLRESLDPFQVGPDLANSKLWMQSGYLYMMKIINSLILKDLKKDEKANIDFLIINQKFETFNTDPFGRFLSFVLPFFLVIAYVCPLCILVFRMVKEKETRAKEGMKIMGMGDLVYFLSYFLQFLILNTFTCLINASILSRILDMVSFIHIFGFIWLYGMCIFSLGYFFQAIMDKTRIAMIISILIYFLMFFISAAVSSEDVKNFPKIILSLFPPTCLQLGVIVLAKFESSFLRFDSSQVLFRYQNYSVGNMYFMLGFDFLLYLFLGFYLENTLPHQFGISKPWYFLCSKSYWKVGKNKNEISEKINKENNRLKNESNLGLKNEEMKNIKSENNVNNVLNTNSNNDHFEDESKYEAMLKEGNCLSIVDLKKKFGEKKKALDGLNLNFYKNEIFALLGHNGAGKSTSISILCGVYESDSGEAYFQNSNILSPENISNFRQKLGICPQHDVLFDNLTVKEHLEMFCVFKGVSSNNIESEVNKTMEEMCIKDKKDTKSSGLSGGQKRKLSIGLALIGGSEVVFLDEPSSGMDITSRRQLWDILKNCMNNRIIVLTTHYMEEAAVLGNRIGILTNGKLKCCGSLLFLIDKYGKYISLNVIKNPEADDKKIIDFISQRIPDVHYDILSEEILFRINKTNSLSLKEFFEDLDANMNDLNIKTYGASMPTLEDVYLNVASHKKMEDICVSKKSKKSEINENNMNNIINNNNNDNNNIEENLDENNEENIPKENENNNENEDINNNNNNKENVLNLNDKNENNCNGNNSIKENENINNQSRNNNIKEEKNNLRNESIKYDEYDINDYEKITSGKKFMIDLKCSLKKRLIQIIRDKKSFMLEIICPVLLVFIGLLVSSVEYIKDSPHKKLTPDSLNIDNEKININSKVFNSNENIPEIFNDFGYEINVNKINSNTNKENSGLNKALIEFNNKISPKEYSKNMNSYASYFLIDLDFNKTNNYEFALMSNSQSKDSMVIYTQLMLNKIINHAVGENVEIEYINAPFPLTFKYKNQSQTRNSSNLVFFISVAFALIPANFITIIIKERELNTKHLQIISGITTSSYWISNFIFELLKYFFTSGICIIFIVIFDAYVENLILIVFLYGISMVSFTYLMSFFFKKESTAQNSVILVNFFFGALGGTIVLVLRIIPETVEIGKLVAYFFRIFPSFAFSYGYNQLLSIVLLLARDFPETFMFKEQQPLSMDYAGTDLLFLGLGFIISTLFLIIIEFNRNLASKNNNGKNKSRMKMGRTNSDIENLNDSVVIKEKQKAEQDENLDKYSITVRNLQKNYKTSFCGKDFKAINDLSFCMEYGECFALLGVNGAGKTTTFKTLTCEHFPTFGNVFINGKDITQNFDEVRSMIGYCPQFDAIFDYMTVYENLEFYGKIKGVKEVLIPGIITSLIDELKLSKYKNDISGNLSGGNKRKLSVGIAMIGNPPIILLDEPSNGMDPEARRFMWGVIHKISSKRKKSSVILTTHSMEEAETLCRRMGIMVGGQFKCIGTSQYIKDKYGYGYEIDIRIMNIPNSERDYLLSKVGKEKDDLIDLNILNQIMQIMEKEKFLKLISAQNLGKKIYEEISEKKNISIIKVLNWVFYTENILKCLKHIKLSFSEIYISEFVENNYKIKIKKNNESKTSIGFLFGMLEEQKKICNLTEYSISQTSLEQIFNKFALQKGDKDSIELQVNKALEIAVDNDLLDLVR